jgi:hypothetical protein
MRRQLEAEAADCASAIPWSSCCFAASLATDSTHEAVGYLSDELSVVVRPGLPSRW